MAAKSRYDKGPRIGQSKAEGKPEDKGTAAEGAAPKKVKAEPDEGQAKPATGSAEPKSGDETGTEGVPVSTDPMGQEHEMTSARHEREHREMNTRHEREMREMRARHGGLDSEAEKPAETESKVGGEKV